MKQTDLQELFPLWPDAPRLCPQRTLPPYRFVAGLNPHPTADPAGHSYGAPEAHAVTLPPERWRENEAYLFGVDLYHQGFLWESHEAWESVWQLLARTEPQAQFYQALIKNSAAQIKAHAGVVAGTLVLSKDTRQHLETVLASGVCDTNGRYMGLRLPEFLLQLERHYGPVWRGEAEEALILDGPAPRLVLE